VGVPLTIDSGKRNRVCIFPEVFTNRKRVLATVVDKTVDDARSDAIDKWAAILHLNPASAQLGRQFFAVHDLDDAGALVLGTVTDVLAPKSYWNASGPCHCVPVDCQMVPRKSCSR
jgi:hypothetical protein